ncbi:hypothetical protein B0O99DRAFT_690115 [Bisporella sp. PMI_857]|nr:hypothetical protein B0O99DRAFT_690115 [Bisporella sp. PMI_857]
MATLLPEKSTVTFKELSEREKALERESVEAELTDGKRGEEGGDVGALWRLRRDFVEIALLDTSTYLADYQTHKSDGGRERELYPRLESVDQEIQGTQLDIKSLESGERYIAVRFGLKWAGAIRKLDAANWRWILRQSYEFSNSSSATLKNPCLAGT